MRRRRSCEKLVCFLLLSALTLSLGSCSEKEKVLGTAGDVLLKDVEYIANYIDSITIFDGEFSKLDYLLEKKSAIARELAAVEVREAKDWSADKVKLPVYGISLKTKDGSRVSAAWTNGYWITRDGNVYKFDFDFNDLVSRYELVFDDREGRGVAHSGHRYLCLFDDKWETTAMLTSRVKQNENVTMTITDMTDNIITAEIGDKTSCASSALRKRANFMRMKFCAHVGRPRSTRLDLKAVPQSGTWPSCYAKA